MLLDDGPIRTRAVEGARALQAEYGIERYVRGVARAYEFVGGAAVDEVTVTAAADRIRRRRRVEPSIAFTSADIGERRHERTDRLAPQPTQQ